MRKETESSSELELEMKDTMEDFPVLKYNLFEKNKVTGQPGK